MKQKEKKTAEIKIDSSAKRVALAGVCASLSIILGYVEMLIPFDIGIPGIKLGLANVAVLFVLICIDLRTAVAVSVLKVCVSSLLFGNFASFLYSFSGALLSLTAMALMKKSNRFGTVGISIIGGASHNIGQILAAVALTTEIRIALYLPVLLIAGTVTGALIGVLLEMILHRVSFTK